MGGKKPPFDGLVHDIYRDDLEIDATSPTSGATSGRTLF
jgi:hypothetical protein